MKKRVLSLLLALVMMFSLLPVNVLAAEVDAVSEEPEEGVAAGLLPDGVAEHGPPPYTFMRTFTRTVPPDRFPVIFQSRCARIERPEKESFRNAAPCGLLRRLPFPSLSETISI